MSNVIFCDEAGITGNNLLDPEQPYFVFASVNIESESADELVARTIREHSLKVGELKGGHLIKSSNGRKAILSLIRQCCGQAQLTFYNKRYSLAGQFYQHTFDEIFGEQAPMFYAIDFNRFIANALYLGLITEHPLAIAGVTNFQSLMRQKLDATIPTETFSLTASDPVASLIETIILFCNLNQKAILNELNPLLVDPSEARWILELSYSALYDLLSFWAERHDSIEVFCDFSKPIRDQLSDFDRWVGRHEKINLTFGRGSGSIGFNLAKPIQLVDSRSYAGVQIADVLASSLCFALNHRADDYSWEVFECLRPAINERSVSPDLDEVDIRELKPYVNSALLWQLVDRSCRGQDMTALYDKLPEFLIAARNGYAHYRASLTKEELAVDFSSLSFL
jgi:hypothetical protein